MVSIKSLASGKYVVAGSKPLIASSKSVTKSAKFEIVTRGYGLFGLKALANGKYVTTPSYGKKPLIANKKSVGYLELARSTTTSPMARSPCWAATTSWFPPAQPVTSS